MNSIDTWTVNDVSITSGMYRLLELQGDAPILTHCIVADCVKPILCRRLCATHYHRIYQATKLTQPCSDHSCTRGIFRKKLCWHHYWNSRGGFKRKKPVEEEEQVVRKRSRKQSKAKTKTVSSLADLDSVLQAHPESFYEQIIAKQKMPQEDDDRDSVIGCPVGSPMVCED